ncbi:IS3 family transposase [Nitrospirillum sp. BR 11752]|uniref:IS3 family transposase n=1 Tax=Nitrospirillum sp. BR 11752 TaxID=3104293 RepID=UPI002EAFB78F|nr:IS3 family transposase [Nitrospirillum sp. BR 11752]
MGFQIIEDCQHDYPVWMLCSALNVSPSGYYAWRQRPESNRAIANQHPLADIRRIHDHHWGRYGVPRIHATLRAEGHAVSWGRVEQLMHRHGIKAKKSKPFRVCTTDSKHDLPIAPNRLDRDFAPAAPNQVWVTDITFSAPRPGWSGVHMTGMPRRKEELNERPALCCEGA